MEMEIELFQEEINGKRQRGGGELDANVYVKKGKTAAAEVESAAEEEMVAWLMLEKDAVVELGDFFDSSEQAAASLEKPVKFADDPYSSLVVFQTSAAYVTINGNEEMCGSSFSDTDSSVMASIDTGRRFPGKLNVEGGDWEASRWLDGRDFMEGIFVKTLSGRGLFDTPPPQSNANGGGGGGGGGEEEMWMDFVDEDLLGESW